MLIEIDVVSFDSTEVLLMLLTNWNSQSESYEFKESLIEK